ncbi:MAG: hypothetical protein CVV52_11800 [Spirochaetae bacterium HGW-Spirochaetae-8]|nr:MAG: hypothetical protein CVV52_11800 [Spirochaetae bacterium HGW-Spirochaetae-8]
MDHTLLAPEGNLSVFTFADHLPKGGRGMEKSQERKNLWIYGVLTYLLFWVLLMFTGLLIKLEAPVVVQEAMKNVCAWSPTFVLLILFRRLFPGTTFREFLTSRLSGKMRFSDFAVSLAYQVGAMVVVVGLYVLLSGTSFGSLEFMAAADIVPIFLITLTSGPLGEELGWRGYVLGELMKRNSPFSASIKLGLIWGFWHIPLWLLTGYTGTDLLLYIGGFLVTILATSLLITYFYQKSRNVFIAVWIHFWFNFLLRIVNIDLITMVVYLSLAYFVFSVVLVVVKRDLLVKR